MLGLGNKPAQCLTALAKHDDYVWGRRGSGLMLLWWPLGTHQLSHGGSSVLGTVDSTTVSILLKFQLSEISGKMQHLPVPFQELFFIRVACAKLANPQRCKEASSPVDQVNPTSGLPKSDLMIENHTRIKSLKSLFMLTNSGDATKHTPAWKSNSFENLCLLSDMEQSTHRL